jgi:hypothetical protein
MLNSLPRYNVVDELKLPEFLAELSIKGAPVQSFQSAPEIKPERENLSVFFGIGMAVNIVMIVTFFVWAVKQWRKNGTNKK